MATETCVSCEGKGICFGLFPVYGPDHKGPKKPAVELTCHRCNGSGQMPAIHREWIAAGKAMKAERKSRGVTQRAEAARRCMKQSELSFMEQGLVQPVPAERE